VDAQYQTWMPAHKSDSVKFADLSGNQLSFVITSEDYTQPRTIDCGPDGLGGCKCPECASPSARIYGTTTDTTHRIVGANGHVLRNYNSLSSSVIQDHHIGDSIFLDYNVLDHSNNFLVKPNFATLNGDTLFSAYQLNGINYSDVIVHHRDTTLEMVPNPIYNVFFVLTTYYSKSNGVVAFYDLKTQAMFYRKP
jgi:hypothetical protein